MANPGDQMIDKFESCKFLLAKETISQITSCSEGIFGVFKTKIKLFEG
jgi:hypothetical protein